MGRRGHFEAREVIIIVQREREKMSSGFSPMTPLRWSCRDSHTTMLNRGGQWCSDGEIVSDVRGRDWSRGGYGG
jgi:hypothetical protein